VEVEEAGYVSGWASRGLDCKILDSEAVIYDTGRREDIPFGFGVTGLNPNQLFADVLPRPGNSIR